MWCFRLLHIRTSVPVHGDVGIFPPHLSSVTHIKYEEKPFTIHLQHIERFLQRTKETGLTLKLWRCKFCQREVKFCGKIVGNNGRRPDLGKVMAIQNLKPAKTKTEVRRLLWLFGYFRDHIPNYESIARPITDLTAKKVPNKMPWSDVHTSALNQFNKHFVKPLIDV